MRQPLEVVAAFVLQEGKFLLCRRPLHKARGGQWEFPGGKVEAGESRAQALARELREELSLDVLVSEECAQVTYDYPELTVRLTLLAVSPRGGRLQLNEHLDARYVTASQAGTMDLCPADRLLLEQLERKETYGI